MKHSETLNNNTTVTTKDYFDLLFWRCSKQSCSSCNGTKIQQLTSRLVMYFYSKIARNPKFLSHCPIMNWVTSDQHSPMKRCQFSTRIPRPCRPDTQFYIHDIVQVSGYHKPLQLHWREPNHSCWVLMPKDCIEPMYGTLKDSNVRLVLLSSQEFGYFLIGALQKRIVSVICLCLEISYPQSTCLIIILIYILFMFQNVLYFHM